MPLGRFAAYFLLLMTVCLVAFPRAVGVPAAVAALSDAPDVCVEGVDGSVTCDAPTWRPHSLRRHPRGPSHAPSPLPRLEAGPASPMVGTLCDVGHAPRPQDS